MPKDIDFFYITEDKLKEHLRYEKQIPENVYLQVLERDNWACRSCNSGDNIAPHHIRPRFSGRDHHPDNLVTLCFDCHRRIHDGDMRVAAIEGNFFFGGRRRWR